MSYLLHQKSSIEAVILIAFVLTISCTGLVKADCSRGIHTFEAYAEDLAGNVNKTKLRTIFVDIQPPTMNITFPLNGSTLRTNNFTLNYTYKDCSVWLKVNNKPINNNWSCWYAINNGTNITIPCDTSNGNDDNNVTIYNLSKSSISGLKQGLNNLTLYGSDGAGNVGSYKIVLNLVINQSYVNLVSPEPNTMDTDGVIRFVYHPYSPYGIKNCTFYSQAGIYTTIFSVANDTDNVLEVIGVEGNHPLYSDDLQWRVGCFDNAGNNFTSETRHLDTRADSGSTEHGGGGTGEEAQNQTSSLNPKYIDIIYSSDWYIGQDYTIQVHAYNQDNQLYDPANITFKGDSGFELTSLNSSIATFHVSDMKEGLHDLKVIVQDERSVENTIEINVLKLKTSPQITQSIPKVYVFLIVVGIIVFICLLVALIVFEVYRRKKRR